MTVTTKDIREYFKEKFKNGTNTHYFDELRMGTGWSNEQRADGYLLHLWPSKGFEKTSFEFKTSRSDFLSELKNPQKRFSVKSYSDHFIIVTANDIVKDRSEIPEDCGWWDFNGTDMEVKIHAPKLPPINNPDWAFVCALVRHAYKGRSSKPIKHEEIFNTSWLLEQARDLCLDIINGMPNQALDKAKNLEFQINLQLVKGAHCE